MSNCVSSGIVFAEAKNGRFVIMTTQWYCILEAMRINVLERAFVDLLELEYMWKIVCCSIRVIDTEASRQTVSPVRQFVAHLTCKLTQLSQTLRIADAIGISEQCQ